MHSCKLTSQNWHCTRLSLSMWCNAKVGDIINYQEPLEKLLDIWDLHHTADSHMSRARASGCPAGLQPDWLLVGHKRTHELPAMAGLHDQKSCIAFPRRHALCSVCGAQEVGLQRQSDMSLSTAPRGLHGCMLSCPNLLLRLTLQMISRPPLLGCTATRALPSESRTMSLSCHMTSPCACVPTDRSRDSSLSCSRSTSTMSLCRTMSTESQTPSPHPPKVNEASLVSQVALS